MSPTTRYSYVTTPYLELPWLNWLHVTVWLHALFLAVMAFLLYLQAQGVNAITNMWMFVVTYSILGVLILIVHLLALLWYLNTFMELSNACGLVTRITFSTYLTSWFFTLLVLGTWLQNYAGDCCDAPLISTSNIAEWALYNNALVMSSTVLFVLVPVTYLAVHYHFAPERQVTVTTRAHKVYDGEVTPSANVDI